MDLNIGFKADEKYVSTNLPQLKAWEIHDVKFDGSFHNIYGTHDNTSEQLQEFISNYRNKLKMH